MWHRHAAPPDLAPIYSQLRSLADQVDEIEEEVLNIKGRVEYLEMTGTSDRSRLEDLGKAIYEIDGFVSDLSDLISRSMIR